MRVLLNAAIFLLMVVEMVRCTREVKELFRRGRWLAIAGTVGLTVMSIGIHGEAMLHDRLPNQHETLAL